MQEVRVLIVDDEREFATALAERLALRGLTAKAACDGLSALAAVAAAPPTVVLLDLMMPGMDGMEVLRCLQDQWPHLPVIILTGRSGKDVAGECLRMGAFRFLTKPADIDALCDAIAAASHASADARLARNVQQRESEMNALPRILVVDDEERFRLNMVKLLETMDMTATAAASGEEGLAELGRNPYDVVLLDMRMPGLTGLGVLSRIRETGSAAKVIVLTGHASVDDAKELLDLGAYDYLLKPARIETIANKIKEACAAARNQGDRIAGKTPGAHSKAPSNALRFDSAPALPVKPDKR